MLVHWWDPPSLVRCRALICELCSALMIPCFKFLILIEIWCVWSWIKQLLFCLLDEFGDFDWMNIKYKTNMLLITWASSVLNWFFLYLFVGSLEIIKILFVWVVSCLIKEKTVISNTQQWIRAQIDNSSCISMRNRCFVPFLKTISLKNLGSFLIINFGKYRKVLCNFSIDLLKIPLPSMFV